MFISDFKTAAEEYTGLKVFPMHLPEDTTIPCIVYRHSSADRSSDSNMSESNIEMYVIDVSVYTNTTYDHYTIGDVLRQSFNNKSGVIGVSDVLISRVETYGESYDKSTRLYESKHKMTFKVLKNSARI